PRTDTQPTPPPVAPTPVTPPPTSQAAKAPPVQPPAVTPPSPTVTPQTPVAPPTPVPVVDQNKLRARQMVVDARLCLKDGRLVEAGQKAAEAQKLKVVFGPDEDSPEKVLIAVQVQAKNQIDGLMQQANQALATAGADPSRLQKAEASLAQARRVAMSVGLDTHAIDTRMASLRQSTQVVQAPQTPAPVPGTPTPQQKGETLLQQARLELRRGETGTARRLATEAFTGPYGVQAEAEKVIRSIDAEEFNQRMLAAGRSYDAGLGALQ